MHSKTQLCKSLVSSLVLAGLLSACSNKPEITVEYVPHTPAQAVDPVLADDAMNIRTVARSNVSALQATKTPRNYGTILLRERNIAEDNRTQVVLSGCIHPTSGNIDCNTYLYPIDKEGELISPPISLINDRKHTITLAEGSYYMKAANSGHEYLVSGEIEIKPMVTSYIRLVFE